MNGHTASMSKDKTNHKKIAEANGKRFVLSDWQKNLLSSALGSLFTGALLLMGFYYNTTNAVADHTSKIENHTKQITATQTDVGSIKTDVAVLKSDVGNLKDDMKEVKGDVKEIRSDTKKIYEILLSRQK